MGDIELYLKANRTVIAQAVHSVFVADPLLDVTCYMMRHSMCQYTYVDFTYTHSMNMSIFYGCIFNAKCNLITISSSASICCCCECCT